jgi:hypothetical protein
MSTRKEKVMAETNRHFASRRSRPEDSRKGKGAALERAIAQWIEEHDKP